MTGRATRHHFLTADLVVGLQFGAFCSLEITVLPLHIVDLGFRTNELFRISVTSNAPFHKESIFLIKGRHIIYSTVTRRTADAFSDVDTVIEIRVIRQLMDALPLDRLIIAITGPDRLEVRAVGPYLAMAIHTCLRRGHSGRRSRFHRLVAVAAVDTVVTDVVLVAELHRLLNFEILPREIRRASDLSVGKERRSGRYYHRDHNDLCNVVCALLKNLCHLMSLADTVLRKSNCANP